MKDTRYERILHSHCIYIWAEWNVITLRRNVILGWHFHTQNDGPVFVGGCWMSLPYGLQIRRYNIKFF